jgi:hypothetical protein
MILERGQVRKRLDVRCSHLETTSGGSSAFISLANTSFYRLVVSYLTPVANSDFSLEKVSFFILNFRILQEAPHLQILVRTIQVSRLTGESK